MSRMRGLLGSMIAMAMMADSMNNMPGYSPKAFLGDNGKKVKPTNKQLKNRTKNKKAKKARKKNR